MGERMDRREEAVESGFDLPFEGRKREKVVINWLLFIPPAYSPASSYPPLFSTLFSFTIGRKKVGEVAAPPSQGMRYAAARGKASDSARRRVRASGAILTHRLADALTRSGGGVITAGDQ